MAASTRHPRKGEIGGSQGLLDRALKHYARGRTGQALALLEKAYAATLPKGESPAEPPAGRCAGKKEAGSRKNVVSRRRGPDSHLPSRPSLALANNLACIYVRLGRLDDAVSVLERMLEFHPANSILLNNLGYAYLQRNEITHASRILRKVLCRNPYDIEARINLGLAHSQRGAQDAAAREFRRALAYDPASVEALTNLGCALKNLGRYEEAVSKLREAIEHEPGNLEARNNLACVYQLMGRLEDARAELNLVYSAQPDDEVTLYNLAVLELSLGEKERAKELVMRYLMLWPTGQFAKELRGTCSEFNLRVATPVRGNSKSV